MALGIVGRPLPQAPVELHTVDQIPGPVPGSLPTLVLLPPVMKWGHLVDIDCQISRSRGCRAEIPSRSSSSDPAVEESRYVGILVDL